MSRRVVGTMLHSLTALAAALGLAATGAHAGHFRGGTLSWSAEGEAPGMVRFHLTISIRRDSPVLGNFPGGIDAFAEVGDVFVDTISYPRINFGDGSFSHVLEFRVVDFNAGANYLVAEALEPGSDAEGVPHTYGGVGPYRAYVAHSDGVSPVCCRIDALVNRVNGNFGLETGVRPLSGNAPPRVDFTPIFRVPRSEASLFMLSATDVDGDRLRWRLSTELEASGPPGTRPPGSGPYTKPPGLSIDADTGLATWDNTGLPAGKFWAAQFVVEDLDAGGLPKSKSPVDVLLRICPAGISPTLSISPDVAEVAVATGETVVLTITATDPTPGQLLELDAIGLPEDAVMSPALPVTDVSGVSSTFSWIAPEEEPGIHTILFGVTEIDGDKRGCQVLKPVTIVVEELLGCEPPTCSIEQDAVITVEAGDHLSFYARGTSECKALTFDYGENGLPAGAYTDPPLPRTAQGPARVSTMFNWTPTALQSGTHVIEFVATDDFGQESRCSLTIHVVTDNYPPNCLSNQKLHLWPPSGNFRTINLPAVLHISDPEGLPLEIIATSITQDEPVGPQPDARNLGTPTPQVRLERLTSGNGRVYHVTYSVVDSVGWTCTGVVRVHVPRGQGQNAVDGGPLYDSTVPD